MRPLIYTRKHFSLIVGACVLIRVDLVMNVQISGRRWQQIESDFTGRETRARKNARVMRGIGHRFVTLTEIFFEATSSAKVLNCVTKVIYLKIIQVNEHQKTKQKTHQKTGRRFIALLGILFPHLFLLKTIKTIQNW